MIKIKKEYEAGLRNAKSVIRGGGRIYEVLVGKASPDQEDSLRVDYACVLQQLGCLDLRLNSDRRPTLRDIKARDSKNYRRNEKVF